jgi:hypothetical protein
VPAPEPCCDLITADVVAFVHGGVVLLVGTASADRVPALTRGFAPRIAPDRRSIDVFVGRAQSAVCLANLPAGAAISITVGNPVDYRGIQIKGTATDHRDAAAGDAAWLERYRRAFEASLVPVGIPLAQSAHLWCRDMVRITFVPAAIFRQTPGPGAGSAVGAGSPWT